MSATFTDPVANVQWIPLGKIRANDYNPNVVAPNELRLLYHSIKEDGYTQPVVTYYNPEDDTYIIVDGFHRYLVMMRHSDIRKRSEGRLPVVVINKNVSERMASTVRHNRARGKHEIGGMANLVFAMLDDGLDDVQVCRELGMEPDELIRLKYVTGLAKLFEGIEYKRAWETRRQIKIRRSYEAH